MSQVPWKCLSLYCHHLCLLVCTTPSLLLSLAFKTHHSLLPALCTRHMFLPLLTYAHQRLPFPGLPELIHAHVPIFSLWVSQRFWHAHTAQKNYLEGWVTSISKDVQSCAQFKGHTFYSPVILFLIALLQCIKASSRYSHHAGRYNSFIERE